MATSKIRGASGAELELALRCLEGALGDSGPTGRHARAHEDAPDNVVALRKQVIRQAEALPKAYWPREVCGRCGGEREVSAVQASYREDSVGPEFTSSSRLCPLCGGTGLTLHLRLGSDEREASHDG